MYRYDFKFSKKELDRDLCDGKPRHLKSFKWNNYCRSIQVQINSADGLPIKKIKNYNYEGETKTDIKK